MEDLTFTASNRLYDPTLSRWCPGYTPTPPVLEAKTLYVDTGCESPLVLEFEFENPPEIMSYSEYTVTVKVTRSPREIVVQSFYWGDDTACIERRLRYVAKYAVQDTRLVLHTDMEYMYLDDQPVLVVTRPYIPGSTLQAVWHTLTSPVRQQLARDAARLVVGSMAVEFSRHGYLSGSTTSTTKASGYLKQIKLRNRLLELTPRTESLEVKGGSMCDPTHTHMMLTPDNIITSGNKIVGILGVRHMDVVPQPLVNEWYSALRVHGYRCLFSSMIRPLYHNSTDSVVFSNECSTFVYEHLWLSSPTLIRRKLNEHHQQEVEANSSALSSLRRISRRATRGRKHHREDSDADKSEPATTNPFRSYMSVASSRLWNGPRSS